MGEWNVGVIGAGSISEMHLNAYRKNDSVNLYALCDLNEERARGRAEKFGITRVFTDYRELLADPAVDAVSICTWNNTHAEIGIAALEAGKHVLMEKPLCRTMEEALRMEEAVRRTGRLLQVGFVRRFGSNAAILKEFIDRGELGDIYYAKASMLRRAGNPGGWFADIERSGGGPLIDIGVHVIDLVWYLMGRPKVASVSGNTYSRLGNRANIRNLSTYRAADYDAGFNTVEDLASAMIRFDNGASLMVDVSFALHLTSNETSIRLFGDKGGAELDPEFTIVSEKHDTILNMSPQVDHAKLDLHGAFQNEIDHFVACCRSGEEPISPVKDGVEVMKMICGIYESGRSGNEIRF
jgi:predicted dehydrogenase